MNQDIAIVGVGCLLPDASNYSEFESQIYSDKEIIRSIDEDRWKKDVFLASDSNGGDDGECNCFSDLAAQIRLDVYKQLKQKFKLDSPFDTRLITYAIECFSQVLGNIKNLEQDNLDLPLILGCMNPDVRFLEEHIYKTYLDRKSEVKNFPSSYDQKILQQIHDQMHDLTSSDVESLHDESVFQTYVFKRVAQKFQHVFKGRGFLVDAACASSLSALDIACNQLKAGQEDLVIAGGIESNLSAGTYIVFSRVGALTKTTTKKPLDENSSGMVQGEGCTLFALERLDDAIKNKRKIYGVIKSIDGSSDGRSASLFQPTKEGQILAYQRVWKNLSTKPFFIEAHATGTSVGDDTESGSIDEFFKGDKTYIGAIKGKFGHTKGNAGAISVLKGLLIYANNKIPGNRQVEKSRFKNSDFIVNEKNIDIKDDGHHDSIAISSFGFGGCNYHLALERMLEKTSEQKNIFKKKSPLSISVIKKSFISIDEIDRNNLDFFPFPPKSISNIDIFQIAAISAVYNLFENTDAILESLGKKEINVVSCGKLGINKNVHLVDKIMNSKMLDATLKASPSKERDLYLKYIKNKCGESITLSEDIGPGILNNVIAGRISNVFDLHGKNYHIDKGFNSLQAGMYTVGLELALNSQKIFLVIDTQGDYDGKTKELKEKSVTAYLVTHRDNIPAIGLGQVEEIQIEQL